jgi:ABC-type Zn uptake system ZnuABC Zn-binding protein ZnuA
MKRTRLARCLPLASVLVVAVLAAACASATTRTTNVADTGPSGTTAAGAATSGTAKAPADGTCPEAARTAGGERSGPRDGELQVVTTVAPITSIVANVAGDRARVTGIIPEGEDSHTFEPRPSAARVLSEADVVLVNGLELEDPTRELAEANLGEGGQVLELGSLTLTEDQYIHDFSFPEDGGQPNPHLWTNPPMARCYAEIAASVLAKADPANADTYRRNAAAHIAKIDRLDELMQQASAAMPASDRELLTYHDAFAYFAEHYDWKVLGAIQVSSFEDPTPREVAALIEQIRTEDVAAIFGSEVFPSTVLEQISTETGVRYVDSLRDDDLPGSPGDPDHSFLGLMKHDFVTMVSTLGGDASGLEAFDPTDVVIDRAAYPQ